MRRFSQVMLFVSSMLTPGMALAQGTTSSEAHLQASMLLRVMNYDQRNYEGSKDKPVRIAILDIEGSAEAVAIEREIASYSRYISVLGHRVEVARLTYSDTASLDADLRQLRPAALFVARAVTPRAKAISTIARQRGALTFTANDQLVRRGDFAVAIVQEPSGMSLLVNREVSIAEGARLDAALLDVVQLVGDELLARIR